MNRAVSGWAAWIASRKGPSSSVRDGPRVTGALPVPAEVLVDPEGVERVEGGVVGGLADTGVTVERHETRVVELAHLAGAVAHVAGEAGPDDPALALPEGELVAQRPGQHRRVRSVPRDHPPVHRERRVADVRDVEEPVRELVDGRLAPDEDAGAVECLEERGMERVVRADERGVHAALVAHHRGALRGRKGGSRARVVLVDARAPQPELVAVEEYLPVALALDLAHAEVADEARAPDALHRGCGGEPVEIRVTRLPQARLLDREARPDLARRLAVDVAR